MDIVRLDDISNDVLYKDTVVFIPLELFEYKVFLDSVGVSSFKAYKNYDDLKKYSDAPYFVIVDLRCVMDTRKHPIEVTVSTEVGEYQKNTDDIEEWVIELEGPDDIAIICVVRPSLDIKYNRHRIVVKEGNYD